MATFIALVDFTPQGLRAVKDSPSRSAAFVERARSAGATVKDVYWTSGSHDGVLIFDAPDDAVASTLMLSLAMGGNVKTTTLRAYGRSEMEAILGRVR